MERNDVRTEIERTKQAMSVKLEELAIRADRTRRRLSSARERVSVRHQISSHPFASFGASVATGFAVQRLFARRPRPPGSPPSADPAP